MMRRLVSLWTTPGKRWLYVRLLYLLIGLTSGVQYTVGSEHGTPFSLLLLFLILTLVPWFVVSTIGIHNNPAVRLRKPSWFRTHFTWREPLQSVHDGALLCFAAGAGVLLGVPFGEPSMWTNAVYICTFGLALWAGEWLSTLIYRENIEGE
jgi:hypothetical protein